MNIYIHLSRTAPNRVLLYINNLRFYLNRWCYCTALLECAMPGLLDGTEVQDNPKTTYPFYQIPRTQMFNNTYLFGKYCGTN